MAAFLGKTASVLNLTKGSKEIAQAIENAAKEFGADISFYMGGKHPFAEIEKNGTRRKMHFAGTPGDSRRAAYNQAADVRRMCRNAGWLPTPPQPKPQKEQPVVSMASVGKGSMFDAQQNSQGPASPVISHGGLNVFGVPLPPVPKFVLENDLRGKAGSPVTQTFVTARTKFVNDVFAAAPAGMPTRRIYDDIIAAFELVGYKVTRGALEQAKRISDKDAAPGVHTSRRRFKPEIKMDAARLLQLLRDPPSIPEYARVAYRFGEVPTAYKAWAEQHRNPWLDSVFTAGGSVAQVVEALNKAGNPATELAILTRYRAFTKGLRDQHDEDERQRMADELKETAIAERAAAIAKPASIEAQPARITPRPVIAGDLAGIIAAVEAYAADLVRKALGDTDIEELKRKAKKWDTHMEIKRLRDSLRDDE